MEFRGWPIVIGADIEDAWDQIPVEVQERAKALAGRTLWTLTGQMYGLKEATARPCFRPLTKGTTYRGDYPSFWPGLLNGAPGASGPCGCSEGCSEVAYDRLALPGPADSVVEVMIDGVVVDPATYRLDHRRWLHRIDGQRWPTHQDLHAADDAVGAFTVVYMRGLPVPEPGDELAGVLALEYAKAGIGGACRLPDRATSVSRQGVSVELGDPREWFTEGLTGIEQVDMWIMAVNPTRSRRPARVSSPEARLRGY